MSNPCVINWGDVPTWVSAIGSIATLLIALWLLYVDLKDRREAKGNLDSADARKVSAWYEPSKTGITIFVQNMSEEPVYYLVVNVGNADSNLNTFPDPSNRHMDIMFGTLGPLQKQDYKITDERYFSGSHFPDIANIAVEFTDCKGVHWRRFETGELRKIPHRKPFD